MDAQIRIAPSILSAVFHHVGDEVRRAEAAGADVIHIDVMDGHFVPNITVGALVVSAVRRITSLPLDVHLMIEKPENFVEAFAEAGADILTIHPETPGHWHRTLQQIHSTGVRAGVALNPGTSALVLEYVISLVDLILVMTVNPGFGGQTFIPEMLAKIAAVRRMLDAAGSSAWLSVDGGINVTTAPLVVHAGADMLVAGTAIFDAPM
jgi:ribulose-phosphate 3-epimerase